MRHRRNPGRMMFPTPTLEGFIVVVQHRPTVARRLESALSHAGATVFTASTAAETIEIMNRYQAHLVVVGTHDAEGVFNEDVVFSAFHRGTGRICYSETFPKDGLITWARWVDIKEPAAAVVEEAISWRQRMKE
ncbi:hypothetical protein M2311_003851 [Rhizobium leguminosarum]|nr:hypothetical protein [Rhizobium leguminosarum]